MNEKLVTIARFSDYMQAELARQLLDGQGIKAFVMGQNVASIYGGVPAAVDVELQTPESQADEAREILEANRPQGNGSELEMEEDVEQGWDGGLEGEQDEEPEQE